MKTTLVIDDKIMSRLKQEAARRRTTISALVEDALRLLLDTDVTGTSNREALYGAMGVR